MEEKVKIVPIDGGNAYGVKASLYNARNFRKIRRQKSSRIPKYSGKRVSRKTFESFLAKRSLRDGEYFLVEYCGMIFLILQALPGPRILFYFNQCNRREKGNPLIVELI